ncbi:hypothetical protein [Bradyrhizobium ivorense]|uniref:hypothetical protein n=1 Tax=Bradyrhizobium ivorense TaxID=2511166 RepID=UPI0010B17CC6|nr:hypothetical protein [Bradyrhizobium ivorense]VIO71257.1 hypothetical protein CI41S_29280 [Bradyrhizobium ivorense]
MDLAALTSNPIFNLCNGLVGIVGVALAIYFYFKAKERYTLSYKVAERQLIQASSLRPFDMDVPLNWGGHDITRLTRSFILITNSGNKLVESSDISSVARIRVSDKSTIIEAKIVYADDPGSQILISGGDSSSRTLDFAFIREREGCIIKVDHTGFLNEVFVECRTKASGSIKKISDGPRAALTLLVGLPTMWAIGSVILRYVDLPLPEPFDRASMATDATLQHVTPFLVGLLASVVVLFCYILLTMVVTYAKTRTFVRPKRAAEIFTNIGINLKRALE